MPNHVWCEGKLLTVEDKCSLICVKVILAEGASLLEKFDPGALLVDSFIVGGDQVRRRASSRQNNKMLHGPGRGRARHARLESPTPQGV